MIYLDPPPDPYVHKEGKGPSSADLTGEEDYRSEPMETEQTKAKPKEDETPGVDPKMKKEVRIIGLLLSPYTKCVCVCLCRQWRRRKKAMLPTRRETLRMLSLTTTEQSN